MTLYSALALVEKSLAWRSRTHAEMCELAEIPVEGLITDFTERNDGIGRARQLMLP